MDAPTHAARRSDARFAVRAHAPSRTGPVGLQCLSRAARGDVLVWVPEAYASDAHWPVLVLLHGAGGTAQGGLRLIGDLAEVYGVIVVAPTSAGQSWDVLYGGYGPDVQTIDSALGFVFDRYTVDQQRLAIGGFSDGASYALSLGIANGDLISHIVAFSPGFVVPGPRWDAPGIYVSHGTRDQVLSITRCSRRIVPLLREAGYQVTYREFDGPHSVPIAIAREALTWFCGPPAQADAASQPADAHPFEL